MQCFGKVCLFYLHRVILSELLFSEPWDSYICVCVSQPMEGLHDAVSAYMCMLLSTPFPFCTAWYGEKQQNMLLFWIHFKTGF